MPKISDLPSTDFPSLSHMFPVELDGETHRLTINQVRAILLYSAAEVSFQTGITVEDALNDLISGKADADAVAAAFAEVYTKSQTDGNILTAINGLIDGATLDTLKKLSTAIADDASFSTTMSTALGKRLRFDAAQTLSPTEKTQALNNLGGGATGKNIFLSATAADARFQMNAGQVASVVSSGLAGTLLNQWTALAYVDFLATSPSCMFIGNVTTTDGNIYVQARIEFYLGASKFSEGALINGFMNSGGDSLTVFGAYQGLNVGVNYRARIFAFIASGPISSATVSSTIHGGCV